MNQQAGKPGPRVEPDFFPPGSKVCFICVSSQDTSGTLKKAFQKSGYLVTGTSDVRIAKQKLRLNQYQVIVIEAGQDFREIFMEISTWPGNVRREVNLIVMGRKAPSLHQQMSFVMGANYYLNLDDAPNLDNLIEQIIKGHAEYYQPWNQAREEIHAG